MACFIAPLAQAVATTMIRKQNQKKGNRNNNPYMANLPKLETMLWGGSTMLIVDHIINGEVVPYYPFFTALETEGGAYTMLREICTVGLPMSVVVTLIWVGWVKYQQSRKTV